MDVEEKAEMNIRENNEEEKEQNKRKGKKR